MKIAVITVWQPWAQLIAAGCKPHEFRHWCAHRHHVGTRIGIHAGMRAVHVAEVEELIARLKGPNGRLTGLIAHDRAVTLLQAIAENPDSVERSAILCTARLHQPLRTSEMVVFDPRFRASDIVEGVDDNGPYTAGRNILESPASWAWPLTDVRRFDPTIPWRGAQGFWPADIPDEHFTPEELA